MKKQHFIILATISIGFTLICMDKPSTDVSNKFKLDLTSRQLPVLAASPVIDFTNIPQAFKALTKDRAFLLKSFIAQEQRGLYCKDLDKAERVVRKVIPTHPQQATPEFFHCLGGEGVNVDCKTMNFILRVAQRSYNRLYLMNTLKDGDSIVCKRALKKNIYGVNAYGSFEPYKDRIITPLHHVLCQAAEGRMSHKDAQSYTKMLLNGGANPNAIDESGNTPIHHASTPELMMLLFDFGARYDDRGYEDRTPLQNHIRIKNWDAVRWLLKLPVHVNTLDDYHDTPLHEAVRQDAPIDIVCNLLVKEASCDAFNAEGQRPVDMAQEKPHLLSIFESHLQYRLCKAIAKDDGDDAIGALEMHGWINLVVSGRHILDWAKEFYPDHAATQLLNGDLSMCYTPIEGNWSGLLK